MEMASRPIPPEFWVFIRPSEQMREDVTSVLAANREFYRILTDRDVTGMAELWSQEHPVACIHPGWDALHDRDQVMQSWQQIMLSPHAPDIQCSNETPYVIDDCAFVICHETLNGGTLAATNIFRREDGDWRMIHHQASPLASLPNDIEIQTPSARLH